MDAALRELASKLTDKQRRLAEEYAVNGGNGTEAARTAGYGGGELGLRAIASRTLATEKVRAYVEALTSKAIAQMERRTDSRIASLSECLETLTRVQRFNIADYLGPDGELDVEKVKGLPPGVVKKLTIKSTTDKEGQVY